MRKSATPRLALYLVSIRECSTPAQEKGCDEGGTSSSVVCSTSHPVAACCAVGSVPQGRHAANRNQ